MILMITEQGASVGIEGGKVTVRAKDILKTLPKELIESVSIFGNIQLSTPFIRHCLTRNIPISYFSTTGEYFGRTASTSGQNILRLKKQIELFDQGDFRYGLAYRILEAKINNQLIVLRRYKKYDLSIESEIGNIERLKNSMKKSSTLEEMMGYEGIVSRLYFQATSRLLPSEFKFEGRSKRPPRDPFNSMISLGYTLLLHEMIGQIEAVGLSPYGGFIHGHRRSHPSLASDLIEEYRAVLIDSMVVSMVLNHETKIEDFTVTDAGVFLSDAFLKKFLAKLQQKLMTRHRYLQYIQEPLSYRKTIYHQCRNLAKAVEEQDFNMYEPIRIR